MLGPRPISPVYPDRVCNGCDVLIVRDGGYWCQNPSLKNRIREESLAGKKVDETKLGKIGGDPKTNTCFAPLWCPMTPEREKPWLNVGIPWIVK